MLSARRAAVLLCLASAASASLAGADGFAPWTDSGFLGADQRWLHPDEIYPRGVPELSFELDATVMFARGTPWTQARAVRQIRRTAGILGSCGVRMGRIRLVRLPLGPDRRRIDVSESDPATGVPAAVAELSALLPAATPHPVAFLIARVAGTESLAVSYRARDESGPGAPYLNTAWIGYRAHWLPRKDEEYSALAHEFAHLLCRCGHTAGPTRHLLHSARNFLASTVLPEHCRRIASSPLLTVTD